MHQAVRFCAGALVLAVAFAPTTGCGDDNNDKEPVTADGSAASASDGGGAPRDAGAPADAGPGSPNIDAGISAPLMDAAIMPSTPTTPGTPTTPSTPGVPVVDGGQIPDGGLSVADASSFDAAAAIAAAVLPARVTLSAAELGGTCERNVNDESCDRTKLPIVFVHGTVANGDSFAHPAQLLASNGYCPDRIRGIEYHSLIGSVGDAGVFTLDRAATYAAAKSAIDAEIASLRAELGVDKVDLAGHSQGAGHGAAYTAENPDKVAHYINLAGGDLPADPGGVPTLNLSSVGDRPADAGTSRSVIFQDPWIDHSAVSSSTEAFVEIYKFLNDGREPTYTTVQCGMPITLEGKAQTFGDNQPLPGATVEVYELGESPTERGTPVQSYTLTEDAKFGPFQAKPNVAYEFKLVPAPGDTRRISHVYAPPFVRSERLLRLNFETRDRVAGTTSNQVNRDPSFAVIIPRNREKAFLAERDTLTVDGREILTRANTLTASATATPQVRSQVVAALYLYDRSLTAGSYGPGDGQSTGESIVKGAFVNSADVFIPAAMPRFVEVKFNGRALRVPNWPSSSVGTSVVLVN